MDGAKRGLVGLFTEFQWWQGSHEKDLENLLLVETKLPYVSIVAILGYMLTFKQKWSELLVIGCADSHQ